MVEVKNLFYKTKDKIILNDISIKFPEKKFIGIIGPNGAGKSTLLKNIYGVLTPNSGNIFIDNKNIKKMNGKERAKKIAVLSQEDRENFDFSIEDIVEMGRYPYKSIFENYSKKDRDIAFNMLKKTGMEDYIGRNFKDLSGGEKQRVLIARALAQDAPILILDEPTNHLDIGYQLQLLHLIKHLDKSVIAALHDLNVAAIFCDYIYILKDGKLIEEGIPEKVLNKENLKNIFNIECSIGKNPINDKIQISYTTSHYHVNGIGSDHFHEDHFTGVHTHIIEK
ncbi:ABC transporter ATP-binding protein [Fusobacterium perfoetens]|uniref:ABC transporter ATP-binding protein n=1 Tax=Fusobacterium perfoetens TaxID=852 RepID=UPI001F3205D1|nr:ABC transporter ATP-binding protein [Fusobacterium perfoetens]MCF2626034.1 ABC transporter ATP-binding protein [Fusobacterium perfoetens]